MQIKNPDSYNAYVITACALCEISYNDESDVNGTDISAAVTAAFTNNYDPSSYNPNAAPVAPNTPLETNVVWGPAYTSPPGSPPGTNTYSLMFIAQVANSNEYFVVIRGTNFGSMPSWYNEDFAIYATLPLTAINGLQTSGISSDVTISQATYTGISDLLNLTDPNSGQTALAYLQGAVSADNTSYIYITGHSLGGTISPAMYAFLANTVNPGSVYGNMAMFTFAGLTAGGTDFNNYLIGLSAGDDSFQWRIQNNLDVAPLLFQGPISFFEPMPVVIKDIYKNFGVPISSHLVHSYSENYITDLFKWANQKTTHTPDKPKCWPEPGPTPALDGSTAPGENFYQQPSPAFGFILDGTFQPKLNPIKDGDLTLDVWPTQALYQHHSNTYYQMVYQHYSNS